MNAKQVKQFLEVAHNEILGILTECNELLISGTEIDERSEFYYCSEGSTMDLITLYYEGKNIEVEIRTHAKEGESITKQDLEVRIID